MLQEAVLASGPVRTEWENLDPRIAQPTVSGYTQGPNIFLVLWGTNSA
jgi:hypothetical protein